MGELTEARLAALTFDYRKQFSDPLMSYAGEITVLSTAGHELLQALRNGPRNFRCGHRAAGADAPRKGHACAVCPGIIHKSN